MKRKLDEIDLTCIENPAKIQPSEDYYGGIASDVDFQGALGTTPLVTRPPMYASTPSCQLTTSMRNPQASTPYPIPPPSLQGEKARRRLMSSEEVTSPGIRAPRQRYNVNSTTDAELRRVIDNFVEIYEQLDKSDFSDEKPNYSYTELAYLAMLRSPNFCLPIAQIYSYMQGRFKFFRNSSRKHWKNAVRHSLAKTMCFSKIPVGRGTSDKENLARSTYLWCIVPNSIAQFARGDYRATIDRETGTNTLRSAYFAMNSGHFWDSVGDYIADKMALFRNIVQNSTNPGTLLESQTCSVPSQQRNLYHFNQGTVVDQALFVPMKMNNDCDNKIYQQRNVFQNIQNFGNHLADEHRQLLFPQQKASSDYARTMAGHTSVAKRNCNAQSHAPATEVRIPEMQAQIHMRRSPTPHVDTWGPATNITSPHESFCSTESECRSPLSTRVDFIDSGFETTGTSHSDSSCKYSSISNDGSYHHIPQPYPMSASANLTEFEQFDLSPFSLSDFTETNQNCNRITPDKRGYSPSLLQVSDMGHPVYMSTPNAHEASKVNQCRFMFEPVSTIQNGGQSIFTAPMQTSRTNAAPVYLVSGDTVFAMSVIPENTQYFH